MTELTSGIFNAAKGVYRNNKGSILRTIVYTIGHFLIATSWSFMIIGVDLSLAAVDAIVEPILNGFWFYALLYSWNSQPRLAT